MSAFKTASQQRNIVPRPTCAWRRRCARSSARLRRRCSHAGLRVRQCLDRRSALQGRGARAVVFALRQSDRGDLRAAACALFEGTESARATATGRGGGSTRAGAAARAGDHVVARERCFGSCRWVVGRPPAALRRGPPRSSIGLDLDSWRATMLPNTATCFLEPRPIRAGRASTCRPWREIRACRRRARSVVDNVFSTPLCQSRSSSAPTCVVYSATKHIDGQGRLSRRRDPGGGGEVHPGQHPQPDLRQTGPSMSPFNAWVLLKGLETLSVRVQRQTDTAAIVAVALRRAFRRSKRMDLPRAIPSHPQADIIHRQMKAGSTLVAFRQSTAARRPASSGFQGMRSSWSRSATTSATPRA